MDKILNYIFVSIILIVIFNEIINYLNKDDVPIRAESYTNNKSDKSDKSDIKDKSDKSDIDDDDIDDDDDDDDKSGDAGDSVESGESDKSIEHNVRQGLQREEITYATPLPWNKIILNQGNVNLYFLEIKNLSNYQDLFSKWINILGENINISDNYLIISSKYVSDALALGNLITMNFLGHISFEEISSANLIMVSIKKAKNKLISQKLVELILSNVEELNSIKKEIFDANTLEAYGGNEFTFL
jgi:hypothetical protein